MPLPTQPPTDIRYPDSRPADEPRRVVKTRRLTWARLSAEEKQSLLSLCFTIYRTRTSTLDLAAFQQHFFSHPSLRLGLFYDAQDQVCGFSNASLLTLQANGKHYRVFSAGVYFLPGYRGGQVASLFGLGEALRQKVRAPYRRLAYVPMASSPAPYHLIAHYALRYWPRPEVRAPKDIEAVLQQVINVRDLTQVAEDPWRVKTFVQPDDVARIRQSKRLQDQPSVHFYEQRNPGWCDAQCATALLMWVPLNMGNIMVGLWRMLLARNS